MVTRNVVLTETQDQLVQALVASGRYQNVSEALRAGLRLLEQEEAQVAGIRQGLLEGLAQARAGEFAECSGVDAFRRAFRQARASSRADLFDCRAAQRPTWWRLPRWTIAKSRLKQADVYEVGPFKRHRAILNLKSVLLGATI